MGKKTIYLVGLGPGDPGTITLQSLRVMRRAKVVYVRTARHPGLEYLHRYGVKFRPLDLYYEKAENFEQAYRRIAGHVINAAITIGDVVYAVPGSAVMGERTVGMILDKAAALGINCKIIPSVSFLESVAAVIGLPCRESLTVLDALEPEKLASSPDKHVLVMQAYNTLVAGQAKLALGEVYPDHHPVTVVRGAGHAREAKAVTVPLYKIDRLPFIDHLTSLYLPPAVVCGPADLLAVMRRLRGQEGCPWDLRQDHLSLRPYLLEEAYEVLEAINTGSKQDMCEELGDLLLQIVFHAQIAAEEGSFSFYDVVESITAKMRRRHPHVFGLEPAQTEAEISANWYKIKKEEKKEAQESLFQLDKHLPALMSAQKVQRQASAAGFDWPGIDGAWDKLLEELEELKNAYKQGEREKIENELGDLLFAAVNVARFMNVEAEQALVAATNKFHQRLLYVEQKAIASGGEIEKYSMEQLDRWWEEAKKQDNKEKKCN